VVTTETARATPPTGRGVASEVIAEGGRNDYLFRLGRRMRAQGLGEAAILAALLAENASRCVPPLAEAEVRATAGSAGAVAPGLPEAVIPGWVGAGAAVAIEETVAGPEPEGRPRAPVASAGRRPARPELRVVGGQDFDERPVIQLTAGRIPHHADDLERHLIAMGSEIYQQGTRLVRIGRWEAASGCVARPVGAGVLIDVGPEWLIDHATRRVNCQVFDGRDKKWKMTDATPKLVNTLLARAGEWHFNHLLGFCDAPTLTPEGRVIDQQGYDGASGLYLTDPPRIAAIGRVTPEEVAAASKYLYGLFNTFPFVSDADAAALLAMVMTALLRRVLPAAPIGCISASTPGTGKSLLADGIAVLATGRTASVAAIGKDAEELEKRVDALLLKGDALCVFDNIDRAVKSDVLCQVSTQGYKSVRVLGLSRMVEAPTNVCLLMTGNNLTLLGDLARRTVVCNLDAGVERPELRAFKRNAITHLLERRAQGIRAALVIAKGYLDAGCPAVDGSPFGSFELWDRLIRRPLMWAGWPDPLQPAEAMREQDHEFAGMVELLAALLEATRGRAMTAADIALLMKERQGSYADSGALAWPLLHEAAETVLGDSKDWNGRVLGRRFRDWKMRILGGLRLVEEVDRGRRQGRFWRVERIYQRE
jgi:putative DNA primase/helicase